MSNVIPFKKIIKEEPSSSTEDSGEALGKVIRFRPRPIHNPDQLQLFANSIFMCGYHSKSQSLAELVHELAGNQEFLTDINVSSLEELEDLGSVTIFYRFSNLFNRKQEETELHEIFRQFFDKNNEGRNDLPLIILWEDLNDESELRDIDDSILDLIGHTAIASKRIGGSREEVIKVLTLFFFMSPEFEKEIYK